MLRLAIFAAVVALAAGQSCTNFQKGSFGPQTVSTSAICRTACERAEGLTREIDGRLQDFKTCTNSTSGAVEGYDCSCLAARNSYRGVCKDAVCSGSAVFPTMLVSLLVALVAMTLK